MELFLKRSVLGSQLLSVCNLFLKPCKIFYTFENIIIEGTPHNNDLDIKFHQI